MMNLVLVIPEYTPGPVYYKPLPPVSDSPPQNTIYNPYDTMYYQQSKEAVPSDHDSYELGSIPLQEYPNQPPIYDAPSIYDTDDYGDATKYASRVNERLP